LHVYRTKSIDGIVSVSIYCINDIVLYMVPHIDCPRNMDYKYRS
jgi:hypothetical protein